ncbi:MAG: ribonuclease H-like domain-containing protein, partial [Candidatus Kapaibacteriota bacterium]
TEFGLSPFTAQIICIGLYFVEIEDSQEVSTKAVAYAVDNSLDDETVKIEIFDDINIYLVSERKAMESFWKILHKHTEIHLVTFNGRNFDCPFIMLRSAILGVKPTRNIMEGTKFNYKFHTDLLDVLTFYQPTFYFSATKRFNLDFYTRSFGIESPKAFGIDGSNVTEYFKDGKFTEIASYCIRDVKSTWELYKKIREYLYF